METTAYICATCGVEYAPSKSPPIQCPICEDERQYVPPEGQQWTTLEQVNHTHKNVIEKVTDHLYAIYCLPSFAIGQRAHLLITPIGNILWDCITNLDESTIDVVKKLGGIKAICISHPHYFSTLTRWSEAFNHAPVYVHSLDKEWIQRKPQSLHLWNTVKEKLWDNIQLICCGGHFPGGNILYWPGRQALFTGDVIQVCPDRKSVSFMYSYPNLIPLPKKNIIHIMQSTEALEFDSIYGAFGLYIHTNAKEVLKYSIKRYLSIY